MIKLEIFPAIITLANSLRGRFGILVDLFDNPYTELTKQTKEVARTLTYPKPLRWEYVTDSTTGLVILKSEKDSEALNRVREAADELFK